jgi:hypothetical protein
MKFERYGFVTDDPGQLSTLAEHGLAGFTEGYVYLIESLTGRKGVLWMIPAGQPDAPPRPGVNIRDVNICMVDYLGHASTENDDAHSTTQQDGLPVA